MAKYKTVKRNGRWVTINTKTGEVVGPGQGRLGDLVRKLAGRAKTEISKFGDNLVYSDKTDDKGRPLTRAQARDGQNADGLKVRQTRPRSSTNTTRNWTNAHGSLSDKPTSGDPKTWKNKPTKSASGSNQTAKTNTPAPAPKKPTAKQAQKTDFNKTYHEARRKALKIKDAQKRKIALEGVAQMGLEFHKKYYNKK